MADNRITKRRLANHWRYCWWKYGIWAVVAVLGIDLLFATTAYRSPEDKRIQLYLCNGYAQADELQEALWPELLEACPGQEELLAQNIDLKADDYYSRMQFSTYIAAREGDVCLLPRSEVSSLASDGADFVFLDLTPYVERGVIDTEGIDLERGMLTDSNGGRSLYAIPADELYGLYAYGCDPKDGMLVAMVYGGNDDTAATLIGQMIRRFKTEPPVSAPQEGQTQLFR